MIEVIGIGVSIVITLLGATWNAFRKVDNRLDNVYTELKVIHTSTNHVLDSLSSKQSDLKERVRTLEIELDLYRNGLIDIEHFLDKQDLGWVSRRSKLSDH